MQYGGARTLYRHGRLALKDCPAHLAVDIDVPGDEPGTEANCYLILIEYLPGCNAAHRPVMLHAPVEQTSDDDWQLTEKAASVHRPARKSIRLEIATGPFLGDLPEPTDPRVHLQKTARLRLATIWFAGVASSERVAAETGRLRDFIAIRNLSPLAMSAPSAVRSTRCGPFRMLTELSIPILESQAAAQIRSRSAALRHGGFAHARSCS